MTKLTRLRGFQDQLGDEAERLTLVESRARELARRYGFGEIRIPLIERIQLFERSSGETSDVVAKQMYIVKHAQEDSSADTMVLRPEGTPGVVRAYIEAGFDHSDPERRFFYCGPMLRYERPQKGRFRQFHQFGVEVFGRADPISDAELLIMVDDLRRKLDIPLDFEINSLGCSECRPAFREALLAFGRANLASLCEDCHARLERNPLRILDCKTDVALTEQAPKSIDYLCEDCRRHFDAVLDLLRQSDVAVSVNPRIVRGLDYYMRTAFEVTSPVLGAQNAVAAGGRYDGLVAALGGAHVPGTGFAIGLERLALAIALQGQRATASRAAGTAATEAAEAFLCDGDRRSTVDAAVLALGDSALGKASSLARQIRQNGLSVEVSSPSRALRAQLKRAHRIGARFALIIGEDELARGVAALRDMSSGSQRDVPLEEAAQIVSAAAAGS
jgi:histidyl-tRNA synthetase